MMELDFKREEELNIKNQAAAVCFSIFFLKIFDIKVLIDYILKMNNERLGQILI